MESDSTDSTLSPRAAATQSATVSAGKLGSLELGRFAAAAIVLVSHMPWLVEQFSATHRDPVFGGWIAPGQFAVQYFFALSGFVMMIAHLNDFGRPHMAPRFWWRRAIRIFPMYWLALAGTLYCIGLPANGWYLVKLVTLAPVAVQSVLPQAWSLHVEMAFYVIFGLCLLPRVGRWILALWLVLAFLGCWLPAYQAWVHVPAFLQRFYVLYLFGTNFTFFHLQFFGGLLAGWLYFRLPLSRRSSFILLGAGIVALLLTGPPLHWWRFYFLPSVVPLISFGFSAVILAVANLERQGVLLSGPVVRRLGNISYPLYILHTSMMLLFIKFGPHWVLGTTGSYVLFFGATFSIVLAASLVAVGVDQPLQRLLRRRHPPRSAPLGPNHPGGTA